MRVPLQSRGRWRNLASVFVMASLCCCVAALITAIAGGGIRAGAVQNSLGVGRSVTGAFAAASSKRAGAFG